MLDDPDSAAPRTVQRRAKVSLSVFLVVRSSACCCCGSRHFSGDLCGFSALPSSEDESTSLTELRRLSPFSSQFTAAASVHLRLQPHMYRCQETASVCAFIPTAIRVGGNFKKRFGEYMEHSQEEMIGSLEAGGGLKCINGSSWSIFHPFI